MRHLAAVVAACAVVSPVLAGDWYIGVTDPDEVVTLAADRAVDGNVIIVNNGRLNVPEGMTLSVTGEVQVFGTGTLDMADATLMFPQSYSYQSGLLLGDQGQASLVGTTIEGNGHSFGVAAVGDGHLAWTNVTVDNGFPTWTLFESASADLVGCTTTGEFLCMGDNTLNISDSQKVLFWLTLPDGSVVDVDLPPSGDVASFAIGPDTTWASGIPYSATITNCTEVWWGVMASSGSTGTFRDSDLRTVGSIFERDNTIEVTGIANNATIADRTYAWGDVSLRFVNSSVDTWNFYGAGTTQLTIASSVFGELLTWGQAYAQVIDSMCDGSGGYLNATEQSTLLLVNSMNLSQTTVEDEAVFYVVQSALLGRDVDVLDQSLLLMLNAEYVADPRAHDGGTAIDAAVEPTDGFIDNEVNLRGSARMIAGPDSFWTFEGYSLEYGPGYEPSQWTALTGLVGHEVHDDTLAYWDTTGVDEGVYTVRLAVHHNVGDPVEVTSPVTLWAEPCAADFNGDRQADSQDVIAFLNAFTTGLPSADFNGDGVINSQDLISFLDAFVAGC